METKIAFIRNKGITLIALVVTIVVLLILAGVTINAILGDNGIIAQARRAADAANEAAINDERNIKDLADELNSIISGEEGKVEPEPEPPKEPTLEVKLKVDEEQTTGEQIPVSVAKITTEEGDEKVIDENLTYKWYINDGASKGTNGTSECTFSNLEEEKTYTIKCQVTDTATGKTGTGEVTVLSFQVVDSFYRGTQGMTWNEWISSKYKKSFPLNEEHYYEFLKQCGWSRKPTGFGY